MQEQNSLVSPPTQKSAFVLPLVCCSRSARSVSMLDRGKQIVQISEKKTPRFPSSDRFEKTDFRPQTEEFYPPTSGMLGENPPKDTREMNGS